MSLTTDGFGPHGPLDPPLILRRVATAVQTSPDLAERFALHGQNLLAYIADLVDDFDRLAGHGLAAPIRQLRSVGWCDCQCSADEHLEPTVLIACADAAVMRYPLLAISIPPAVASYLEDLVAAIASHQSEAGH